MVFVRLGFGVAELSELLVLMVAVGTLVGKIGCISGSSAIACGLVLGLAGVVAICTVSLAEAAIA